jgi:predicted dehydrogenase
MNATRRRFLQQSASALSLPLLSSFEDLSFAPNPSDRPLADGPLRVAIMGLGSYGTRVADALKTAKRAKLVGAISGTPSKLTEWQSKYGIPAKNCYSYETFDQIKANPDIDAVYVITPNVLHREHTIRAARAGKHVICEKPMAGSVKDAEAMIAACRQANVKLLIGYRMHFEPHTLAVIAQRKAGEFGKVLFFQGLTGFRIGDPAQWRLQKPLSGGGALMDIGIYSINGARYMVGEEPVWVTAQETKTDPVKFKEGVDETITFQLGFPGGAVAQCVSTYNFSFLDKFYLVGEKGFASIDPASGYGPTKAQTSKGPVNERVVTHQTEQMDRMADIILDNAAPVVPVDGAEGLRDMKIIEAIYASAKAGGKKIDLKL